MEYGSGGTDLLEAGPGDFLYMAPRAIHRESILTDQELQIVVVPSGSGEPVINVNGPEPT